MIKVSVIDYVIENVIDNDEFTIANFYSLVNEE